MDRIADLSLEQMPGLRFSCGCGREHQVDIKQIIMANCVDRWLPEAAEAFKGGKLLVVSDSTTHALKGKASADVLLKAGFQAEQLTYAPGGRTLVPDEKAVGRLLMAVDSRLALILAVGSGTINDICRFVSSRTGIPYMVIATAPSMDGYASTVSPLIVEGFKKTYEAHAPAAILCDLSSMVCAPQTMICAGFGDIMGKFTALADWELSARLNGEYLCEETVEVVKRAIGRCVENAGGIAAGDEKSIQCLVEALILSGIGMGFTGNSRPASGAEHHLAHYWEMDALKKGEEHPLHGNMVGVATLVIARIYQWMNQVQSLNLPLPDPARIKALLSKVGSPVSPGELGVSREVFFESVIHAKEIRPRYTILHLAEKLGLLECFARKLTEEFYPFDGNI